MHFFEQTVMSAFSEAIFYVRPLASTVSDGPPTKDEVSPDVTEDTDRGLAMTIEPS